MEQTPGQQRQDQSNGHHFADPHKELMRLIKEGEVEELDRFIKAQANATELINRREPIFQQTCIYTAVQTKDQQKSVDVTKLLTEAGGQVKVKDIHGQSPLFYICRDGNIGLLHLFLANGCDINETDNFKQSPLFYASRDGRADCVLEMLRNGANPEHRDKVNETALFYAAREGHSKICEVLIDYGADVNTVDDKKQTALFFARKAGHKETEELLLSKGAINTKDGRVTKADLNKLARQKQSAQTPSESKVQSIKNSSKLLQKRKKQSGPAEEPRVSYKLIFTDKLLNSTDVSEADFGKFREQHPLVAELLLNPEKLDANHEVMDKLQRENWQTVATQLLNTLWKTKGANIFHAPVDPVKLNIPDYPSIVSHPMDFGTIKKKLNLNVYGTLQEFLDDMELVFYNCRLYNGTESYVGKIGVDVNREYDNLLQAYGLKERFENKVDTEALVAEILGAQGYKEEPKPVEQPGGAPQQDEEQQQPEVQAAPTDDVPVENASKQPEPQPQRTEANINVQPVESKESPPEQPPAEGTPKDQPVEQPEVQTSHPQPVNSTSTEVQQNLAAVSELQATQQGQEVQGEPREATGENNLESNLKEE